MKDATPLDLLTDSSTLSRNPPEARGLLIRAGDFLSVSLSVSALTVLFLRFLSRPAQQETAKGADEFWMKFALDLYF